MVTSGGIENDIRATSNIHETPHLSSEYEDLDTGMALHAIDATAVGYERMLANVLTQIRVSDVFKLRLYHPRACRFGCSQEQ